MQEEQAFIQQLLDPKTQNKAFEQLLKEYQKPLYHHIRNIVLNHDDTDDVFFSSLINYGAITASSGYLKSNDTYSTLSVSVENFV